MPKIVENRLIEEFKDRESFSRDELLEFFKYFEPDLKEGTFGWRIYDLKKKNIIKPLMRGLYTISYKPKYKPDLSQDLLKLAKKINDRFEDVKYCIWETNWLNEFSQHQASKKIFIIETEKDFLDSFFYELKEIYKGVSWIVKEFHSRKLVAKRLGYKFWDFLTHPSIRRLLGFVGTSAINMAFRNRIKNLSIDRTFPESYSKI